MNNNTSDAERKSWWFLGNLPPKSGRYIVLDTETTGSNFRFNNVIELGAVEVINGKLTGLQFHAYLRPRYFIHPKAQEKHKLSNSFYKEFLSDVFESDKIVLQNFLKFIGDSLIFAHNAMFDMNYINNELKYWNLPQIDKHRYRCTVRLYKRYLTYQYPFYNNKANLEKCCEVLKLKSLNRNFHTALFDAIMAARVLCKIFEINDDKNNLKNSNNVTSRQVDRSNVLRNKDLNTDRNSFLSNDIKDDYKNLALSNLEYCDDSHNEDDEEEYSNSKEVLVEVNNCVSLNRKDYQFENNSLKETEDQVFLEQNQELIENYMNDQYSIDNNKIKIDPYFNKEIKIKSPNLNNSNSNFVSYGNLNLNHSSKQKENFRKYNSQSINNLENYNHLYSCNGYINNYEKLSQRESSSIKNFGFSSNHKDNIFSDSFERKSSGRDHIDNNYLEIDTYELNKIIEENI